MDIYGFSLIRNGTIYDYPFRESLLSLHEICPKIYVAAGESDDNTMEILKELDFVEIIPTKWDLTRRTGGLILSEQTNIALNTARKNHPNAWGFYLQADEVLSNKETSQILSDLTEADKNGFDSVRFRYLHFWHRYDRLLIEQRWYENEIRAFKLNSDITSVGDAMGFENWKRDFKSDCHIFHYGHVREPEKYRLKMWNFHALYHPDEEIDELMEQSEQEVESMECIPYLGNHPKTMKHRIGTSYRPKKGILYIIGNREKYPKDFTTRIGAEEVQWVRSSKSIPREHYKDTVFLEGNLFDRFKFSSPVPKACKCRRARPWTNGFRAVIKLSKNNVSFD